MRLIVDTNVLLRAIVADQPAASAVARRKLSESRTAVIPVVVFCEFVWVSNTSYRSPRSAIAASIRGLIADPKIVCDRQAVEAGLEMLDAGGDFAYGVIAFEGRRLGGTTFCSFDRKAAKLLAGTGLSVALLDAAD